MKKRHTGPTQPISTVSHTRSLVMIPNTVAPGPFQLIYPPFMELDHHVDDLQLVKIPHQDSPDGDYDLDPFFKKEEGIWKVFQYKVSYEFCGEICDRIHFMEKLTEFIDKISETSWPNNKKRKYIYKHFTRRKWGYLREG